jgi:hypothetical protein
MVFVRNALLFMVALSASSSVAAFSVVGKSRAAFSAASHQTSREVARTAPLFMAEEEESEGTTFVSSVFKKEIAYDEKTGRFFETGFGEGDCVPDEEFCFTDKQSGELIRLTVDEKERIFLDSLQVSTLS